MKRQLLAAALSACCIAAITPSARGQATPGARVRAINLEFTIVELTGAQADQIEKLERAGEQVKGLINEKKAKVIARLQVRTRLGDSFSSAVGVRSPIQTAVFPMFQSTDQSRRDAREPLHAGMVGFPQMTYENIGLSVEGVASSPEDGKLDIRLKLEMSALDRSTGTLTPTITHQRLAEMVWMNTDETVTVMGLIQQDPPWASPTENPIHSLTITGGASLARASFVVLLTAKPIQ